MFSSRHSLVGARACSVLLFLGCSGTDVGYPRVSDGAPCPEPLGPGPVGGASSSASGSSGSSTTEGGGGSGSGGSSPGAVSGAANGAGTSSTAGSSTTAPFAWPGPFEANAAVADGHHNAGAGCMSSSCHGAKVPFLFGGTIYQADGKTGAPGVQVGISDGTLTVTAYSASNGNVWLPSSAGQLELASAQIAIRSANGERVKPASAGRGAACNGSGCHGSAMRLVAP